MDECTECLMWEHSHYAKHGVNHGFCYSKKCWVVSWAARHCERPVPKAPRVTEPDYSI